MTRLSSVLPTIVTAVLMLPAAAHAQKISSIPSDIDSHCRGGRAVLFDECGSQSQLFQDAIRQARLEDKVLLVSYGAEWCIWCHVFEQYIQGHHTTMTYRYSDPDAKLSETVTLLEKPETDPSLAAAALTRFVAENFVLLHIENNYSVDGYEALIQSGADATFNGGLPYIFTVDAQGVYAAHFQSGPVETRRDGLGDWYRGYDRAGLTEELKRMKAAALSRAAE